VGYPQGARLRGETAGQLSKVPIHKGCRDIIARTGNMGPVNSGFYMHFLT